MIRHLPHAAVLGLASGTLHAAPSAANAPAVQRMDLLEIISAGGVMMYPLALMSVACVVLVLIYLLAIRRNAVVSDRFMETAESLIRKRDYRGLADQCRTRNECMARLTQKAVDFLVQHPAASFDGVREVAEAEGSRQASLLSSRITYLADIGAIAPMVGLLGTVLGMIKAFLQVSSGDVQGVRQMELAEGVSEALVTTAAGLMIGIPALVFYSIFRGRVQKYIAELEAAATHLMALLQSQVDRHPPLPSPLGGELKDVRGI